MSGGVPARDKPHGLLGSSPRLCLLVLRRKLTAPPFCQHHRGVVVWDCLGRLAGLWDSWAADVWWRRLAARGIVVGGGAAIFVFRKRVVRGPFKV